MLALNGPFRAQLGPEKKFLSVIVILVVTFCLDLHIMAAGHGILYYTEVLLFTAVGYLRVVKTYAIFLCS